MTINYIFYLYSNGLCFVVSRYGPKLFGVVGAGPAPGHDIDIAAASIAGILTSGSYYHKQQCILM